jgi:ATP-binding cassette subfamily B protein
VLIQILKKYLHPYMSQVYVIILMLLIQAIASLYLPNLNADLINKGIAKGDIGYIWHVGQIMLGSSALVMGASIWLAFLAAKISMAFGRDLREAVFVAVEGFSARELNKFGAASLITRNTNDVQQVQLVLFMGFTMMIGAPITGVGAIIMAVRSNINLSSLLLVAIPVMAVLIIFLLRRIVPAFRVMQVKIDRINLVLREQIAGVRVIRAFVQTRQEESRFAESSMDLMQAQLKVTRTFAIMFPSLSMILNLSSVAVIWFGARLIESGNLQIGNMTAFLSYIMLILSSVMMAVFMSLQIPRAAACADRIQEVLDTQSSVIETLTPITPTSRAGVLEFKDVEFRYPGAEQPILSNISFSALPGKFTAIIGSTGSGKSTLLNLIPRFIDVTQGSVTIDGVDLRQQPLESIWSEIGFVPQRSFLFGGTVAHNLRYGKKDATDEELWAALEIAQAREFVEELSDKLQARVAQGGTNFSGGQRQRLSIARVLVKNPQILIFDDAFSALDYTTDAKLRSALHETVGHATVIVVAQRVSTILTADQIIVLDEGRIMGIGTHAELMNTCPTYQEIVLSQLSPEEAAS